MVYSVKHCFIMQIPACGKTARFYAILTWYGIHFSRVIFFLVFYLWFSWRVTSLLQLNCILYKYMYLCSCNSYNKFSASPCAPRASKQIYICSLLWKNREDYKLPGGCVLIDDLFRSGSSYRFKHCIVGSIPDMNRKSNGVSWQRRRKKCKYRPNQYLGLRNSQ